MASVLVVAVNVQQDDLLGGLAVVVKQLSGFIKVEIF